MAWAPWINYRSRTVPNVHLGTVLGQLVPSCDVVRVANCRMCQLVSVLPVPR